MTLEDRFSDMPEDLAIGMRARNSILASFLLMGIASMAWVPRIPEIKDAVGLDNGQFGLMFVGATIGSVLGAQSKNALSKEWDLRFSYFSAVASMLIFIWRKGRASGPQAG